MLKRTLLITIAAFSLNAIAFANNCSIQDESEDSILACSCKGKKQKHLLFENDQQEIKEIVEAISDPELLVSNETDLEEAKG